ncbi:MAG: 4-hydroxythreonine-4-phosphate dehydrogenase PdxA [Nitrospirae bacterium]|nr:4-hydroxythreonine-4-phosphate dehydrogenase PdxA [Nitrospirota bacterium]
MTSAKRPVIGITMGDPAGIGPEIIVKALLEYDIRKICRPVVIGGAGVIKNILKICNLSGEIKKVDKISGPPPCAGKIEIIDLNNVDTKNLKLGVPSKTCGIAAVAYIKKAGGLALSKEIDAITTAPINKEVINAAGFQYPGHTELFAEISNTKDFGLMMVGGGLRVIHVTTHIPLKEVPRHIKKGNVLRTIRLAHKAMGYFHTKTSRIAVAALNPHAGEGRLFGAEEWDEIMPAILDARGEGIDVSDPLPADTLFYKTKEGFYDIVVAMYHDQGLIPLKLLAFGRAVNVTVGLPFIRTSVDHGTAYDIAGKDCADPRSLVEAVKLAVDMVGYTHA